MAARARQPYGGLHESPRPDGGADADGAARVRRRAGAARDEHAAASVTERVLGGAAAESVIARDTLVERAILSAVRKAPASCFEDMPQPGRDAVALARLAGYSADQVASSLELGVDDVKKSMLQALRSATLQATA